ncbi:MAG: hypothetical protein LUD47_04685 [Clostridia bacterium]|nr:hypothetical protein [Clostridia bacterium]
MKEKKEQAAAETEDKAEEPEEEERQEIVHTISRAEIYSLTKNVSDIISAGRKIYNNRAVISERLNLLSLIFGMVYTGLYIAYVIYSSVGNKLDMGYWVVGFALIAVYAVIAVVLLVLRTRRPRKNTNIYKKYGKALKVFRYGAKFLSIGIAVYAIVMNAMMGDTSSAVVSILILVFSILLLIVQILMILFGGIAGLCRWLMSPVKRKEKASVVTLEWYDGVTSGNADLKSTRKVNKNYVDEIGVVIDKYVLPALGKRKIGSFTSVDVLGIMDSVPEEDRIICGGVFKNVFKYAVECGYIAENPCRDIDLIGSIDEEEKKTLAKRIGSSGKSFLTRGVKKVGMSLLNRFLAPDDE